MLEALIQFSLRYRLLIVGLAIGMLVTGGYLVFRLPVDVLPDLTRPRVTIITECPGMAPEEVELWVTIPLENALNGATDVLEVRSSSDIGLSVVMVEFDWGQDLYRARQIVQERLATATSQMPANVQPQMAPVASLLGQIMMIGMWSSDGTTGPLELRTQADWVVAQRLRSLRGVAQVITMGGGRKQIQVLVDYHRLHTLDVSLAEIEQALRDSNLNVTGGYVNDGSQELLVRGLARMTELEQIETIVVKPSSQRSVLLRDVARIAEGAEAKRGDSLVNGEPAVVLTIQKQPQADTRKLTREIIDALEELKMALPADVVLRPTYQQSEFIELGIANVFSALWSGVVLVIIVLFLFLLNLRSTLVTLAVIPLSLAATVFFFYQSGMGINVMTLGGIAVGLGMLVDDAIVAVESAHRRLRQRLPNPQFMLNSLDDATPGDAGDAGNAGNAGNTCNAETIVFEANREVLGAIVISTLLVVVVFAPLLMLSGMEGRLFVPLAIAYLVSIVASTLIALTVTPALSQIFLPAAIANSRHRSDSSVLAIAKGIATPLIRFSMTGWGLTSVVCLTGFVLIVAGLGVVKLPRDFLPAFDEGSTQINLYSAPGTSLEAMGRISQVADRRFAQLQKTEENPQGPLLDVTCKLGRAELDEHIMGVNVAEYVMTLNPDVEISRSEMIRLLTEAVDDIPGIEHEIEQPIAHLISHMLSGVAAQLAIKIHGDDLDMLRRKAEEIRRVIDRVPGIAEPFVEQQQIIPQLRFEINYQALANHGTTAREVTDLIETAMQGKIVTRFSDGQRFFDVMIRLDDEYRLDLDQLHRLHVELPSGAKVMLGSLAKIVRGGGPNTINRENARRRIVIRVNTIDGNLGGIVDQIQSLIRQEIKLPEGYSISYGGQFEARQSAQQQLLLFSLVSLVLVGLVLYSAFPSLQQVWQILAAVPAAFIGGALALMWTEQSLSIAALIGFVSLAGIATRNGLLLIGTYRTMIQQSGFTKDVILQGSLERLAPVMMSSLTTGLGLMPLIIGGTMPGKEMLYPVATVIVGGLISSTLCEILIRPGLFWFFTRPTPIENPVGLR